MESFYKNSEQLVAVDCFYQKGVRPDVPLGCKYASEVRILVYFSISNSFLWASETTNFFVLTHSVASFNYGDTGPRNVDLNCWSFRAIAWYDLHLRCKVRNICFSCFCLFCCLFVCLFVLFLFSFWEIATWFMLFSLIALLFRDLFIIRVTYTFVSLKFYILY